MRVSMQQFEQLVQTAVDSIPEQFQPYLENIVFIVEESSPDELMGLYHGAGALHAGQGFPDQITLYKRSHERATSTMEELVEEVSARFCMRSATTSAWTRTIFLLNA